MKITIKAFLTAAAAAAMLSACTPSHIEVVTEAPASTEEETTAANAETQESSEAATFAEGEIPTGVNGGPGLMPTTTADQSDIPEDKRNVNQSQNEEKVVAIYCVDSTGVFQQMDTVADIDENSLLEGLIANEVLSPDTEIVSFSTNDDGTAELDLNMLSGVYKKAKEEQLLACITNTFVENLGLDSLTISADGRLYGTFEYTDEYDRT